MTILLGLENCKICVDCGMENTLKQGDVIQCRECGYRILYKKRTRRSKIYFLWFSFFLSLFIYSFLIMNMSSLNMIFPLKMVGISNL